MQTNIPISKQPFAVKRKKESNSEDSTLLQELTSLPEKLASATNGIQTSLLSNCDRTNELTTAINNLSQMLSQKLDKIIELLTTPKPLPNVDCPKIPNAETSKIVENLCVLKNARNSSVYKLNYNVTHSEVYQAGLSTTPVLIPKKLHEAINNNEAEELKNLKMKRSVRKVEDEIERLSYHSKVQESKIASIDKKARNLLASIESPEERKQVTKKYEHLISLAQESIENKWAKKRQFLQSHEHLIALGIKHNSKSQAFESTRTPVESSAQRQYHLLRESNSQYTRAAAPVSSHDVDMDESEWTHVTYQKNRDFPKRSPRLTPTN